MTIRADDGHITGLWFDSQRYYPENIHISEEGTLLDGAGTKLPQADPLPVLMQARDWLDQYFQGVIPSFTPPLAPAGTAFQQLVWKILLTIPYGHTRTYGDIAAEIAQQKGIGSMSAQAVGGAVGHNPISIMIPCHRVMGANGSLTGYAGGTDRKARLLQLESHLYNGAAFPAH